MVVIDTATNLSLTVATNERGDYVVTPLNPGVYRVSVTLDGFQTALVSALEVQVGQSARADVELRLGAVTESTVVISSTPLLDTESGTLGHVVTNLGDIPCIGPIASCRPMPQRRNPPRAVAGAQVPHEPSYAFCPARSNPNLVASAP